MKTWLITGASRGLGRAMAEAALERGDQVVATARRRAALQPIVEQWPSRALAVSLDVTAPDSIRSGVADALRWSPRIDVLVNNAGHGLHGAVEEVTDAEVRQLFDVNLFGQLDMLRAVLPQMRRQRSGHVINVSSVAGIASDAGTGLYSATKFALSGLSEALRAEVAPLGIKVTVLEPGPFRTEFNGASLKRAASSIEDYAETAGKRTAALQAGSGSQAGDPRKAAEMVCDVAASDDPPLHLVLGEIAMKRSRDKIGRLEAEIAAWAERSRATSY